MRNLDFSYFLRSADSEITTPVRIYLSGCDMNSDNMRKLLTRLTTCSQPTTLHFSHSGITEASAILLAESLHMLKQPLTLCFSQSDIENNGKCISRFTAVINHNQIPFGTRIFGLSNHISELCDLNLMLGYSKILFALSPYATDPKNKTKKFVGFPRDIAQVILGFLTIVPLDFAFTVREKIDEERENKRNSCALS